MKKLFLIPIFVFVGLLVYFEYTHALSYRDAQTVKSPEFSQTKAINEIRFDSQESLFSWKEHVFSGKTVYEVRSDENGDMMLRSASSGTSSSLIKSMDVDLNDHPVLAWKWKVAKFPSDKKNEKFAAKHDNDYAARVCAIFKGSGPFSTHIIQYVWDDHFPVGTYASSPFFNTVKTIVIRNSNGNGKPGWAAEKRDLVKDYEMLFGKEPNKKLAGIAIMSDSDNTKTESEAYLKNIAVLKPA